MSGARGWWLAFSIAVPVAIACGDDAVPSTDSGPTRDAASPDGSVRDVPLPTLPTPPALPDMAPCPEGWRALTDADAVTVCEPWPESGRADCGDGEAHFPGTAGCAPVGAPCPTGQWPTDLPAGRRVWYVQPGGTGDGSMGAPFGSVTRAHSAASAGDVIALAKGTHRQVPLGKDIEVVGACAAETRITPASSDDWAVLAMGSRATLRNVTIGPTPGLAVVVSGSSTLLTMRGVVIEDTTGGAIVVGLGSGAVFERLRVRRVRLNGSGQSIGISVQEGSTATIDQATFEETDEDAIVVSGAATATLSRVAIWGTDASKGYCADVRTGGSLLGTAFVCEDGERVGVLGSVGGATLDFTHLIVRRIAPAEGDPFGRGVVGQGNSTVTLSKAVFEDVNQMSLLLGDEDPTLPATGSYSDILIRATRLDPIGFYGSGMVIHGQSVATAERVAIIDSHFDALIVQSGASLDATDVTLHGSVASPVGGNGAALLVSGATATIERLDVQQAQVASVVAEEDSDVTLRDVSIRETQPSERGTSGFGMAIVHDTRLEAERVLIEGSHSAQVTLEDESHGLFTDLSIRDGLPREANGAAGVGVQVLLGSSIDATRALVERNLSFGVLIVGTSTMPSTLRDLTIAGTRINDCPSCDGYGSGVGVFDAQATVTNFLLSDNELCGVHIGPGGSIDLSAGEVTRSAIGVCITDPDYALERLQSDVDYRDNDTNLDSTTLPVPEMPPAPDFDTSL